MVPIPKNAADSMWRLIGALIIAAMVVSALQLAIVAILLWGLIFRTKEAVGLLVALVALRLFATYPYIGLAIIATIVAVAIYQSRRRRQNEPELKRIPFKPMD